MGVNELNRFVHECNNIFLQDYMLHNTKLLVDGSNLIRFLYYNIRHPQLSGGDYDLIELECRKFFEKLQLCNVQAFVVFDTGSYMDIRKLEMVRKNKRATWDNVKKRQHVLPILALATLHQVLDDLGVAQASCASETDREIAILAKRWNCPILSDDSDFYIFDLKGGFIPIVFVLNKGLLTETDTSGRQVTYLPVKRYKRDSFSVYFQQNGFKNLLGNNHRYVLPMFASLMGNDFVEPIKLEQFYNKVVPNHSGQGNLLRKVTSLFRWLDSTANEEDALSKLLASVPEYMQRYIKNQLQISQRYYRNIDEFKVFDLEKLFNDQCSIWWSDVKDYNDRRIPEWVLKQIGLCKVDAAFLLNVLMNNRVIFSSQVEDVNQISSYVCSRGLRALIFGIAFSGVSGRDSIAEYDRNFDVVRKQLVKPRDRVLGFPCLPTLDYISSMHKEERRKLLYAGLGLSVDVFSNSIAAPSQFILGIMGHWYKSSKPQVSEFHLKALIICIVMLHINAIGATHRNDNGKERLLFPEVVSAILEDEEANSKLTFFKNRMGKFFNRNNEFAESKNFDVEHGFAQFQTILVYTLQLNKILQEPVSLPNHTVIINCSFVYNLCRLLRGGALGKNYIRAVFNWSQTKNVQKLINSWFEFVVCLSQGKAIPHQEEETHEMIYSRK